MHPTPAELQSIYTPNAEELAFAQAEAQRLLPRLGFLILLKTFQRLGYFPQIADVPLAIAKHIAKRGSYNNLPCDLWSYDGGKTRLRLTAVILRFLRITA